MEAAYCGVHLWAQAVQQAGTDDVRAIRATIKGQCFDAPEGPVRIDPETQHASKISRIGRIRDGHHFEVVYSSEQPIPPVPYPGTRSKETWDDFLIDLYLRWGGQWVNPGH
jgi:urea transport system substrate-binding protein